MTDNVHLLDISHPLAQQRGESTVTYVTWKMFTQAVGTLYAKNILAHRTVLCSLVTMWVSVTFWRLVWWELNICSVWSVSRWYFIIEFSRSSEIPTGSRKLPITNSSPTKSSISSSSRGHWQITCSNQNSSFVIRQQHSRTRRNIYTILNTFSRYG